MAGAVVENLSNRKLFVLISLLMVCLLVCFLLGGLVGKFARHSLIFLFIFFRWMQWDGFLNLFLNVCCLFFFGGGGEGNVWFTG